jgi:acetylornithine deacetylase/succinyl-diaminopimelate desuccinylase
MINTHVDTVPPITMEDPFNPVVKDGKIYGRGAADTKGLIASLIVAMEMFKEDNPDKDIPVSIAFTVDEENHTALGSAKLLEIIDDIETILVLEPTYGTICNKQMGTYEFEIEVEVDSMHASEFEKTKNPAKISFHLLEKIEKALNRPVNIINFKSGWDYYAVPEKSYLLAEVKLFENENRDKIEKNIFNIINNHSHEKIKFVSIDDEEFLNFKTGKGFEALKKAYEAAFSEKPNVGIMPSWTDAANYYKKKLETFVFGFASLKDAHTKREHISFEELEKNIKVFYNLFSILI